MGWLRNTGVVKELFAQQETTGKRLDALVASMTEFTQAVDTTVDSLVVSVADLVDRVTSLETRQSPETHRIAAADIEPDSRTTEQPSKPAKRKLKRKR